MWVSRQLAAFSLGLAFAIYGLTLMHDSWAQERNERIFRENARLKNSLFQFVQPFLDQVQAYGMLLVATALIIMNKFKLGYFFAFICIFSQGLLYHSPLIIKNSDRFGGFEGLQGASFYLAALGTLTLICFKFESGKFNIKFSS